MLGYIARHAYTLATCHAIAATPTGQAHMLPLQTLRATSPADSDALCLMHYPSAQIYPWLSGENGYQGVFTN